MKKRLVITGASGFVAGRILAGAGGEWEVHALSSRNRPEAVGDCIWHSLDLGDSETLSSLFGAIVPDAVIHAAAMADIDACEANPAEARRVNVELTRSVVDISERRGARIIHLSTDTVFDGERGDYRETDPPNPVNVYAETKVKAERLIQSLPGNWAIARLSLVLGLPALGGGNSFLAKWMREWEAGKPVGAPPDEIRTPVDVRTLARALLELAASEWTGIVHLAGSEALSRYDLGRRIAARLGHPESYVVPKSSADIPGRARRPRDASLDNSLARSLLKTPMRNLDEALDRVLDPSGKETP